MSDIKKIKELLESVTYEYENGDLSKEDYLELVKDINTSEIVAKTSEEVKELTELNGLINNIVTGISLVA
jgi:hypothetical protein